MNKFETQITSKPQEFDNQADVRDEVLTKLSKNPNITGVSRYSPHIEDSIHITEDTGNTRVIAINPGRGFMSHALPEGVDLAISVVDWNKQNRASDKTKKGGVRIFVSGLDNGPQFIIDENDLGVDVGEVLPTIAAGIELFKSFHRLRGDQRHEFPGHIWDSQPRYRGGHIMPENAPIDPKYLKLVNAIQNENYTIVNHLTTQPVQT